MQPSAASIRAYRQTYDNQLRDAVIPFWLEHSLDRECGGYLHCLERDGSVFDTDKFSWMGARELWMWATLYNEVDPRPEYLDAATLGAEFLRDHGWDASGRVPFALERNGTPFIKPRGIFSESFVAIGMAAFATASGEAWALEHARRAYGVYLALADLPATHDSSTYSGVRPALAHGVSFIKLATTQELRRHFNDGRFEQAASAAIDTIVSKHVRQAQKAVFEYVTPGGQPIPGPMGRQLCPGHGVESMGFILGEAARRDDAGLIDLACEAILWSLQAGWDSEFGGLHYFVDAERSQNRKLEGDMKLWWVHAEALVAALRAYQLTGRAEFWHWFERIHLWAWSRFPDPEHGEWFGYLHRDGTVALSLKGSMWKGFFHLPRALIQVVGLLDRIASQVGLPAGNTEPRAAERAGS
jgi:N-acylglucosamine 2-epimerase